MKLNCISTTPIPSRISTLELFQCIFSFSAISQRSSFDVSTVLSLESHTCFCIFSEMYLEPTQKSTMDLFCENIYRLKNVHYFRKKAPSKIFEWVLNTPLMLMIKLSFKSDGVTRFLIMVVANSLTTIGSVIPGAFKISAIVIGPALLGNSCCYRLKRNLKRWVFSRISIHMVRVHKKFFILSSRQL